MIEIRNNLHVGSDDDWKAIKGTPKWSVVHCAKEPYHREALGYETPGAPKDHPDYLYARRGNELCLNMVDARSPEFIPLAMIKAAISFIYSELKLGRQVLVHCNRGESRGPTVAFLYMARDLDLDFKKAEKNFYKKYSVYNPGPGCREFAIQNWSYFRSLG